MCTNMRFVALRVSFLARLTLLRCYCFRRKHLWLVVINWKAFGRKSSWSTSLPNLSCDRYVASWSPSLPNLSCDRYIASWSTSLPNLSYDRYIVSWSTSLPNLSGDRYTASWSTSLPNLSCDRYIASSKVSFPKRKIKALHLSNSRMLLVLFSWHSLKWLPPWQRANL